MLNECELALAQASENNTKFDQTHDTQQGAKLFCRGLTCEAIMILILMNCNTIYIADITANIAAILLWHHS